jgi:hypothetical protein
MKKLVIALALAIFTVACAPSETTKTTGMMCDKCTCCQQMAKDKSLKEKLGLNKDENTQCMMGKDGKKCCCDKMMDSHNMDGM